MGNFPNLSRSGAVFKAFLLFSPGSVKLCRQAANNGNCMQAVPFLITNDVVDSLKL